MHMETTLTLNATPRMDHGKGPARRLRASGKLPAVMYGPDHAARAIAVEPRDIKTILAAPLGRNTVVTVSVEGTRTLAMLKGYSYHPLSRALEHADFYTVAVGRKITVQVPFLATGKSKGVATQGGILRQVYRTLPVLCTPDRIPAKLEADVTALELGQALHVRDLQLPEGVAVKLDAGQTVVSIVAPEKEERAAEAAPGATPAAGAAPAAGAKDAKAPAAGAKDAKAPAAGAKDAKAPAKDAKKKK
jgi:large subunit ribosomal protein L25